MSVLNIEANMIEDVLQIEYIKTLTNLRLLNVENNDFLKLNIHKQLIFSNNLPLKATIDQTFIKIDDLQVNRAPNYYLPILRLYYILMVIHFNFNFDTYLSTTVVCNDIFTSRSILSIS